MKETVVTQFLIDITRGHLKKAYEENSDAVINASPLSDDMRLSIKNQDIARLWLAGVSPMALLYFARLSGWTMDRYYTCLNEAEQKKAAQAHFAPEARHGPEQTRQ